MAQQQSACAAPTRRQLVAAPALAFLSACRSTSAKLIGVVPKATSHLFFVNIEQGVRRAAREFNVDILWNGPNEETDHDRQIQIVESMINRRVDALAISATDERALAAPVERAIRTGIPVTVFDSGVNVEGYTTFVATDNYGAGCTAARRLRDLIGGRGAVGMVMHKPGGTSTVLREKGFEETALKECPGMTIVARQYGMSDRARSRAAAENILTAHPELAGLFASSEPSSLGTIQAVRSRGLAGKIRLITFDFSDAHVEALRDGTIDVMLVQDPYRIGYEAVRSLAEKLAGRNPPKRLNLPARAIVKSDLDRPDVKALLSPRTAAQ
ncbi:MAG TPA: substrate-binding domain-containing protein [Bryobacteraceae bacterium]|nr:substrate-binding domain-containing protein [Bryobacteraceae bacterium]